ncbi:MAG TPA: 2TM domain-containing protein [Caldimonas sp.]|nr:2TM domain-containing protein [Caldimonas sp.]
MEANSKDADAERQLERRARRRVGMKIGFTIHALVYVLVNGGLYAINEVTGGPRWMIFPLLGWGLGLAIHGIVTFVSLQGEGWRDRMLESEKERLRRRR